MGFKQKLNAAINGAMAANDGKALARLMKAFPAEFLKSSEARREPIVGGRSKYEPHTGAGEKARRRRQMEAR
jgi:hypothetical protein